MKFAVVIPAFNEAATIRDVATRARAQCEHVIVVDDGSSDATVAQLEGIAITLINNHENLGKAASLWRGMQAALSLGVDGVITLDGDGQHRPEDIPRVLAAVATAPDEIVIASRTKHREATPPLRLFANRMANFWISWAAGYLLADSQSGFRYYPASLLRQIKVPHDRVHSFVFESEILIDAAWRGIRSRPVAIEAIYFEAARASHYRPTQDTLLIINMVALRLLQRALNLPGLIRVITQYLQARRVQTREQA